MSVSDWSSDVCSSDLQDVVMARAQSENLEVSIDKVDYMDVSPKQVVAVATACKIGRASCRERV